MLPRSVSFRRYAVGGKAPDPLSAEIAEAIERTRFVALAEAGQQGVSDEEALGWTDFDNFLDTRFEVASHVEHGALRLSLRSDKRVVPAALVRAHVELEKRAAIAAGDKLSKRRLDELRRDVIEDLRPRLMPRTQVVRGLWHARAKRLTLLTTSESAAERFCSYFTNTFDRRTLTHLEPGSLVGHLAATRPQIARLDLITAADLRSKA